MPPRKPVDDRQDRPTRCVLAASDAQFASGRITQELDVLDALSQLIEDGKAALDDCMAIVRRPDAAWATIEEADAESVFEVGDRSRNSGLRRGKPFRRLVHAAGVHHGHEDTHIMQLETALYAIDLIHGAFP